MTYQIQVLNGAVKTLVPTVDRLLAPMLKPGPTAPAGKRLRRITGLYEQRLAPCRIFMWQGQLIFEGDGNPIAQGFAHLPAALQQSIEIEGGVPDGLIFFNIEHTFPSWRHLHWAMRDHLLTLGLNPFVVETAIFHREMTFVSEAERLGFRFGFYGRTNTPEQSTAMKVIADRGISMPSMYAWDLTHNIDRYRERLAWEREDSHEVIPFIWAKAHTMGPSAGKIVNSSTWTHIFTAMRENNITRCTYWDDQTPTRTEFQHMINGALFAGVTLTT